MEGGAGGGAAGGLQERLERCTLRKLPGDQTDSAPEKCPLCTNGWSGELMSSPPETRGSPASTRDPRNLVGLKLERSQRFPTDAESLCRPSPP